MAWKLGVSPRDVDTVVAVASRVEEFPRCTGGLREGRLSLDQVGPTGGRAQWKWYHPYQPPPPTTN